MQRDDDLRILILAPTSNDARLTSAFLTEKGFATTICGKLDDLGEGIRTGCGALLLAEEGLAAGDLRKLVRDLEQQPSWSDLPLILITAAGDSSSVRSRHFAALAPVGNISVIERPVRPDTLVSTCAVALRARRRQYQVRDLLREREALLAQVVEQSRIFDTTLSSIPDFAYIFDRQARFVYANKALLKFLRLELSDVVGKTFEDLGRARNRAARLQEQINHVFETGESVR